MLLVFVTLSGCSASRSDDMAPIKSPDGSLTLTPSVNTSNSDPTKYLCVAFDIFDSSGSRVHHVESSASDRMKWAIGWFDDRTIVLYSSDVGTRAWKLKENDAVVELSGSQASSLTAFGDKLKIDKYGR